MIDMLIFQIIVFHLIRHDLRRVDAGEVVGILVVALALCWQVGKNRICAVAAGELIIFLYAAEASTSHLGF